MKKEKTTRTTRTTKPKSTPTSPRLPDFCIAVLTNGFVYSGKPTIADGYLYLSDAKNVRVWGTTDGLGQLCLTGPTQDTRLDKCPDVIAPLHALIHLLPCKPM
jgi:hypothetical protein